MRKFLYFNLAYRMVEHRLRRGKLGRSVSARLGNPEDGMRAVLLGISSGLDQALARLVEDAANVYHY